MDVNEIIRALGRIEGALEANNKAVDDKFTAISNELSDLKKKDTEYSGKLNKLVIDTTIVQKMAALVGGLVSLILTPIISVIIKVALRI